MAGMSREERRAEIGEVASMGKQQRVNVELTVSSWKRKGCFFPTLEGCPYSRASRQQALESA
jgi:hypothetical protein